MEFRHSLDTFKDAAAIAYDMAMSVLASQEPARGSESDFL
jgi:hypothetical protein